MINLLPEHEKMTIHKEYQFRLWIASALFAVAIIIASFLLLVPSYILAFYRGLATEQKIASQLKSEIGERTEPTKELKDLKAIASVLTPDTQEVQPTEIITVLVKNLAAGNIVQTISYSKSEKGEVVVTVEGIAKTRQGLVDFTTALEKEEIIEAVDLPVTNLAKESNIQFSFTLTAKR